jgi:hypothetical protein
MLWLTIGEGPKGADQDLSKDEEGKLKPKMGSEE